VCYDDQDKGRESRSTVIFIKDQRQNGTFPPLSAQLILSRAYSEFPEINSSFQTYLMGDSLATNALSGAPGCFSNNSS
jgi:hypothetical protein